MPDYLSEGAPSALLSTIRKLHEQCNSMRITTTSPKIRSTLSIQLYLQSTLVVDLYPEYLYTMVIQDISSCDIPRGSLRGAPSSTALPIPIYFHILSSLSTRISSVPSFAGAPPPAPSPSASSSESTDAHSDPALPLVPALLLALSHLLPLLFLLLSMPSGSPPAPPSSPLSWLEGASPNPRQR